MIPFLDLWYLGWNVLIHLITHSYSLCFRPLTRTFSWCHKLPRLISNISVIVFVLSCEWHIWKGNICKVGEWMKNYCCFNSSNIESSDSSNCLCSKCGYYCWYIWHISNLNIVLCWYSCVLYTISVSTIFVPFKSVFSSAFRNTHLCSLLWFSCYKCYKECLKMAQVVPNLP